MIDRVVILNDVSEARGGATGLALLSMRSLRALGVPITIITGDAGENPEFAALGVDTVSINQALLMDAGFRKAALRGLYNPVTARVIGDWITRHDTPGTVYHVHTWSKILSPSMFRALRPVASRLLISAHDFFLVCPNGGYVFYGSGENCSLRPMSVACIRASCDKRSYPQKLWRVARQGVRQVLFDFDRLPAKVLAIHDAMRPGLERGGIPSGSITVLRNPMRPFVDFRIQAEDNTEFVFIGRLDPEKGADLAAAAARQAGVTLRIIGDGQMMDQLRRDYPEVIFSGRQKPEAIAPLVARARALVMSSRYPEPFGLVLGEALWSGLPVIVPDTALLAPEIVERDAGLVYDPREASGLADAMRNCLGRHADVARMSRNAFTSTRDLGTTPQEWIAGLMTAYEGCMTA